MKVIWSLLAINHFHDRPDWSMEPLLSLGLHVCLFIHVHDWCRFSCQGGRKTSLVRNSALLSGIGDKVQQLPRMSQPNTDSRTNLKGEQYIWKHHRIIGWVTRSTGPITYTSQSYTSRKAQVWRCCVSVNNDKLPSNMLILRRYYSAHHSEMCRICPAKWSWHRQYRTPGFKYNAGQGLLAQLFICKRADFFPQGLKHKAQPVTESAHYTVCKTNQ